MLHYNELTIPSRRVHPLNTLRNDNEQGLNSAARRPAAKQCRLPSFEEFVQHSKYRGSHFF